MKLNGQIDYCCADVPIGGHTVCVGFRGGIVETYVNQYHFVVDEIRKIFLVSNGKKRELKITNDLKRKIICELERLAN